MKELIKYKVDFDFIAFCHICANAKELKKMMIAASKEHQDYKNSEKKKSKSKYFKEAEAYYNDTLSFIQRNELDMFFKKTSIFRDYLMGLAFENKELKDQSLEDFRQHILKLVDFDEEKLSGDSIVEELKDHYADPSSIDDYEKESELILEILKDERMFDTIFKNAIYALKDLFVKEKYLPIKDEIEKKLKQHNETYIKDPIAFVLKMSSGIIKKDDLEKSDAQVYIAYFTYYTIMIEINKDFGVVIYHYKVENKDPKEMEKHVVQSLLKFISDRKRYEMIQVLSKERWYANELAKKFGITPATMSYHVNKMFSLGLISFEPAEQNKMYIKLDKERLEYLLNLVIKELTQ
jgi:DNA-binding transcriptional ArsR family regulator